MSTFAYARAVRRPASANVAPVSLRRHARERGAVAEPSSSAGALELAHAASTLAGPRRTVSAAASAWDTLAAAGVTPRPPPARPSRSKKLLMQESEGPWSEPV